MSKSIVNEFAKLIADTSGEMAEKMFGFPVIGTLDGKQDLLMDGFSKPIPKGDFYKVKGVSPAAGDRVLCIPIEDGHTFVIAGVIE